MSLRPPQTVEKLQRVLRAKAKESPSYRFYQLYDKVYRADILAWAWRCCRQNGGSAGVDGQTLADIERYGVERWLSELAQDLRMKTYQPSAVRRVWIPKADGKQRPLGIPTVRDRVVQMAIREVQGWLDRGYTEVVDADLSGYFDSIPHPALLKCVARRISDRHLLHLVKMWLEAPVEETDEKGRIRRTTRNKDEGRGTPQGGVASPLLANLYMRRFVLGWKQGGHEQRLDAHIVNYADDFVICCRPGRADPAMATMRWMMERIQLTVNEQKTRKCSLPAETFTFLGFTFGTRISWKNGRRYLTPFPAKQKVATICEKISEATSRRTTWRAINQEVAYLNRLLVGWANYFNVGSVTKAWQTVQQHACRRLRWWLHRKWGTRGGPQNPPNLRLYETYGLIQIAPAIRRHSLWANA
jgi:group II intron reverse transcriptase/maturase